MRGIIAIVTGLFLLIGGSMYGMPQYNVWQQGLAGQAALERAKQDRQIKVEEAEADKAAALLEGQAEVLRADGVAKANKVMAASLGGPEGYLRWRYILAIEKTAQYNNTVIYIPTEANIPIMEANRFGSTRY